MSNIDEDYEQKKLFSDKNFFNTFLLCSIIIFINNPVVFKLKVTCPLFVHSGLRMYLINRSIAMAYTQLATVLQLTLSRSCYMYDFEHKIKKDCQSMHKVLLDWWNLTLKNLILPIWMQIISMWDDKQLRFKQNLKQQLAALSTKYKRSWALEHFYLYTFDLKLLNPKNYTGCFESRENLVHVYIHCIYIGAGHRP